MDYGPNSQQDLFLFLKKQGDRCNAWRRKEVDREVPSYFSSLCVSPEPKKSTQQWIQQTAKQQQQQQH
jgi:hypothetical protein